MEIAIIGGGIGGLTIALMLHRAGFSCRIYESVGTLRELGVGINLLPHAVRELSEIGLLADLRKIAVETSELCYFNKLGQLISGASRVAWRPVTSGHSFPATAASCRNCC